MGLPWGNSFSLYPNVLIFSHNTGVLFFSSSFFHRYCTSSEVLKLPQRGKIAIEQELLMFNSAAVGGA
jgi:hypothetical protein